MLMNWHSSFNHIYEWGKKLFERNDYGLTFVTWISSTVKRRNHVLRITSTWLWTFNWWWNTTRCRRFVVFVSVTNFKILQKMLFMRQNTKRYIYLWTKRQKQNFTLASHNKNKHNKQTLRDTCTKSNFSLRILFPIDCLSFIRKTFWIRIFNIDADSISERHYLV